MGFAHDGFGRATMIDGVSHEAMDVLMVGPFPEDPAFIQGGVQASVYGLSRSLRQSDGVGSVRVIASPTEIPYRIERSRIEDMDVAFLKVPYRFQATNVLHVANVVREARQLRSPVVHVHGTGLFQSALCSAMLRRGIPLVWTLHGITEKETLQRYRDKRSPGSAGRYLLYRTMERYALQRVPHIIVDTPYVHRALPPIPGTFHVVPQGIFMDELIEPTSRPRDPNLVLSLGVIDPRKGHHLTLEAFARVRAQVPAARLAIVGLLRLEDYYRSLIARVAALGITEAVEFHPNLSRGAILALLKQARVFALHSQEESQGIALCEALASGLPVVSTKVGGIPYVVTDGLDGTLVEYGDLDGFARGITRLLTDGDLHDRMARQAVASSARFDWKNTAAEVVKIYRLAATGSNTRV